MLTRTEHLFDEATRVVAGDSRWQGRTSPDYYAFVGPFGGFTAATILRALIEHPQRAGDPLALTVNYCAPIAEGEFDLDVRLVKANPDISRYLTAGGGALSSATPQPAPVIWARRLARYGGLAVVSEDHEARMFSCGPRVQRAALSSAAHAARKTSV
jgi:hypothetical protein